MSALGLLGVVLFLIPLWHNPGLWNAGASISHAEAFSLCSGFLLVAIDAATQRSK